MTFGAVEKKNIRKRKEKGMYEPRILASPTFPQPDPSIHYPYASTRQTHPSFSPGPESCQPSRRKGPSPAWRRRLFAADETGMSAHVPHATGVRSTGGARELAQETQ